MNSLLIAKNVKYATDTSDTANSAVTPDMLADGSVGIYGIHNSVTNPNREVLITDGGSEAAGKVPAASFNGSKIKICIGRPADANGNSRFYASPYIQLNGGAKKLQVSAVAYVAPVAKKIAVGYNGTSGNLNTPTIVKYADGQMIVSDTGSNITAGRLPLDSRIFSSIATTDLTDYGVVLNLVKDVIVRTDVQVKAIILSSTAGAAITNTATVAAVKGETSLTTSAAHGVGVGDFVRLAGDTYKAITGTTGSTLVLDRPYQGANATIANAAALDLGTDPGTIGVEFESTNDNYDFTVQLNGFFVDSDITITQAFNAGIGTSAQLKKVEKQVLSEQHGTSDQITRYIPNPASMVADANNYDQYVITCTRDDQPMGSQSAVFDVESTTVVAFVEGVADTTGLNQSNFEDAMTTLYSAFPSII